MKLLSFVAKFYISRLLNCYSYINFVLKNFLLLASYGHKRWHFGAVAFLLLRFQLYLCPYQDNYWFTSCTKPVTQNFEFFQFSKSFWWQYLSFSHFLPFFTISCIFTAHLLGHSRSAHLFGMFFQYQWRYLLVWCMGNITPGGSDATQCANGKNDQNCDPNVACFQPIRSLTKLL